MKLKKTFSLALNILLHSKLRTWLTIIGIVIGIGAVVSILAISQGAQDSLEEQLGNLGADIITISPGASRAMGGGSEFRDFGGREFTELTSSKNLTNKDVLVLKSTANVEDVMGEVSGQGDISFASKTLSTQITGVNTDVWVDITTETLSSGRFLNQGDSYSIVIGDKVATSFDTEITINSKVTIEGKTFQVVGMIENGNGIYMPIEIARTTIEDIGEDEFDSILVKVEDVDLTESTIETITEKLMMARGILDENKKDFSVSSPVQMQESMEETMNTMSLFLGAIAAISLIVGAIGIANTMFTSVLEKTKEIGIMKAIGAKNKDILLIFLIKAGLIGLVGGIGGIILGYIVSGSISYLASAGGGASMMLSNSSISMQSVILVLVFSIIIGMIAGAIPAYRASKLNPVDALREE
ncbi:ABC transporter permease [Candidatus Woesearchaeota archaeon]|nr:ABC transporter permease [Candidatus Woesearchaeota archaeon]